MIEILGKVLCNVEVFDNDSEKIIFKRHNLFTNSGRGLIRDIFAGTKSITTNNYYIDFGSGSTAPSPTDVDLVTPLGVDVLITEGSGSITSISTQEIQFLFDFTNTGTSPRGADIIFKEAGLYHSGTPDVLLARVITSYSTVTISNGSNITVKWNITF